MSSIVLNSAFLLGTADILYKGYQAYTTKKWTDLTNPVVTAYTLFLLFKQSQEKPMEANISATQVLATRIGWEIGLSTKVWYGAFVGAIFGSIVGSVITNCCYKTEESDTSKKLETIRDSKAKPTKVQKVRV